MLCHNMIHCVCVCEYVPVVTVICVSTSLSFYVTGCHCVLVYNTLGESKAYVSDVVRE